MFYTDDSQIYLTIGLSNRNTSIGKIEDCVQATLLVGTLTNFLLWNTAKAKVFLFSSKFLNTDPISSINIGANTIKLESTVCDLGVVLDKHFDMSTEVNNICKSASLVIRNIGKIRNYLDQTTTEKLVHAFVTSKIGFWDSVLFRLSKKQLDKLQRILNAALELLQRRKDFSIFLRYCVTSGALNRERATPILGLCHGALTDQFIFRHILGYSFSRQ